MPTVPPEWLVRAERLVPEVLRASALSPEGQGPATARETLWALLPMTRQAYRQADADFVARAFAYASWCNAQDDPHLYNPAAIGFLAKIAKNCAGEEAVPLSILADHLSLKEVLDLEQLFHLHYGADDTEEIKRLIQSKQASN